MKGKVNPIAGPLGAGVAVGAVVCTGVTLVGSAVFAALISGDLISAASLGYCALATLLLASIAGAISGAGRTKEKRLYVCLLVAAVYLLMLLSVTALFFGGQYEGVGVTGLVIFAGCITVAILGANGGKKQKFRGSKIGRR